MERWKLLRSIRIWESGQQAELEMQHLGCLKERTYQTVLLKEAEVLQYLHHDAAYLLQVCDGESNLL